MRSGRYLAMAAAAMLSAAPAMAAPVTVAPVNPAATLSLDGNLRTGSKASHNSDLVGIPLIALIIGSIVIITTIVVVATNSDSK